MFKEILVNLKKIFFIFLLKIFNQKKNLSKSKMKMNKKNNQSKFE